MFNRFRLLKDTLGYSASALVTQGVGLVAGLWVARMLAPADLGVWNFVSLVLVYGAYVDFGVLSAMGRDLPFRLGEGDAQKAAALEGAARTATVTGAVLVAVILLIGSFFWFADSPMTQTGLRAMAFVLILQQIYAYHRTVLRAHNLFSELSQQLVWLAVIGAACAVIGVAVSGLRGRMIGAVLAQAVILLYALFRNPWGAVPRFDPAVIWSLVRVGIPITVSSFVLGLVTTVDRLMVKAFLGDTQLGYFGLALLLTSVVSLVPTMAGQVLYPRITYRFGQSGQNVAALRAFVLIPPVVLACLLPAVIGPASVALPLIIRLFLPAYVPGIIATQIVIVGIFFYSILGLTDYFLVTIGKLRQYVLLGCGALVVNVAMDYMSLRLGYGINGVAFTGTALTYFLYSTAVIGYALSHYTRNLGDWCRYFSKLWLPFAYMVALLWILEMAVRRWMPSSTRTDLVMAAGTEVALYSLGVLPLVYFAAHELKLELSWASLARLRSGH